MASPGTPKSPGLLYCDTRGGGYPLDVPSLANLISALCVVFTDLSPQVKTDVLHRVGPEPHRVSPARAVGSPIALENPHSRSWGTNLRATVTTTPLDTHKSHPKYLSYLWVMLVTGAGPSTVPSASWSFANRPKTELGSPRPTHGLVGSGQWETVTWLEPTFSTTGSWRAWCCTTKSIAFPNRGAAIASMGASSQSFFVREAPYQIRTRSRGSIL